MDELVHSINLGASIRAQSKEEFTRELIERLNADPESFPCDEHCTNGGSGQDTKIIAGKIDIFDAKEVGGTVEVTFTEKFPVGCADIRLSEEHRVNVRFHYARGRGTLEVDAGFPKRDYEPEEF